jgi:5-hydroxyisourate hydrolase-like protein (transthyretin family)
MNKHLNRILSIVINLTLLLALSMGNVSTARAQEPSSPPVESILIHGKVVNAPPEARVQAARADGGLAEETSIDPEGQFAFPPLPANTYHLQVVDAQGQLLELTGNSQVEVMPAAQGAPREYILTVALPALEAQPTPAPMPEPNASEEGMSGPSITIPAASSSRGKLVAAGTGQISGVVRAAGTNSPLAYAYVELYDQAGSYIKQTSTASGTGAYSLTGLGTGTYKVYFTPPYGTDYAPKWYDNQYQEANATGVLVTDGLTTPNINASLDIGGKISGTVTAAQGGAPLSSASVYVYSSQSTPSYDYFSYDYTDASGAYTLTGLPAGSYYLRFEKTDYLTTYYNNKASLATSDAVSVTFGGTIPGINASLILGGKISGKVTAANGAAPLNSVEVYAYTSPTASTYDYFTYDYTDSSGMYALTGLPAGVYYLRFSKTDYLPGYYNNKASLAIADAVSVTLGAETPNINAALTLGGKITGQVTAADGGAPLNSVEVVAYTSPTASSFNYIAYDYTDSSGGYALTGLVTGTYYLRFRPASNADYISQYYNDQSSLATADAVSVALGVETPNIDAALAVGGRVSGRITAAESHAALPDVQVSIYSYTVRCNTRVLTLISSAKTDNTGNYLVRQLPTGNYLARFTPDKYGVSAAYLEEYYNDKASADSADPVSVTSPQTTAGIDAELTKGGTISGLVTAEVGGAPLEDVSVDVYNSQGSYYSYGYTDASGFYTVAGLKAGSYKVEFGPGYYSLSAAYISEYYNNQTRFSSANPVNVVLGGVVSGINAALARGGQFTGKVTAEAGGAPLHDVDVSVYDSQGYYMGYGYTDESGTFTTNGLASGSYRLHFEGYGVSQDYVREYYNNRTTLAGADAVVLSAPELKVVNAALQLGGGISGTVTSSLTGQPLEDVSVTVFDNSANQVTWEYTDENGKYQAHGLPTAGYHVRFSLGCAGVNYQIYYNQKPSLDKADNVSVTAPAITPNINAQLPIPGGTILFRPCYLPLVKR